MPASIKVEIFYNSLLPNKKSYQAKLHGRHSFVGRNLLNDLPGENAQEQRHIITVSLSGEMMHYRSRYGLLHVRSSCSVESMCIRIRRSLSLVTFAKSTLKAVF